VNQTIASVCHTFRGMKAATEAEAEGGANAEAQVDVEAVAAALPAPEPAVRPGKKSSPSHMMPSKSRNDG